MIIPLSFFIEFIVPSVLNFFLMFDYDTLNLHINDSQTHMCFFFSKKPAISVKFLLYINAKNGNRYS